MAARLHGVDAILHAGDVCTADVLAELSAYAPVHAVLGNNDGSDVASWGATETLELTLGGVPIAMIHDSGVRTGRPARLRRMFPAAAVVVFGHSHIPVNEVHDGQRILNPGSPTDRRRQPQGTMAELQITSGRVSSCAIVTVT